MKKTPITEPAPWEKGTPLPQIPNDWDNVTKVAVADPATLASQEITGYGDPEILPYWARLEAGEKIPIDEFEQVLDSEPPPHWVKILEVKDREGKPAEYRYLPIRRLEWLMDKIFGGCQREIIQTTTTAKAIIITCRANYQHPVTGQKMFVDGIGALLVRDVQSNAPAALSLAYSNAVRTLGRIFGRELNNDRDEAPTGETVLNP